MPTPVYLVSRDDDIAADPILLGTAATYDVALAHARRHAGTVPTARLMIGDYSSMPGQIRSVNGMAAPGICDQRVPHAASLAALASLGRDVLAANAAARALDLRRRLAAWDAAEVAARAADDATGNAIRSLAARALLDPLPDAWTPAHDAHDDDEENQHHDELMRLPR